MKMSSMSPLVRATRVGVECCYWDFLFCGYEILLMYVWTSHLWEEPLHVELYH